MASVLIVDDEDAIRVGLQRFLQREGFAVEVAEDIAGAERAFKASPPDLIILDYLLPDGNALELLPRLRQGDETVPVVVLTAHASIDLAVEAVKLGAEQFLAKPVELEALLVIVRRVLEGQRNRRSRLAGRTRRTRESVDPFVGESPAIRALADQAARVVDSPSPILIQGETGSGKGVLARWLHANGPRSEESFVDLNCAGLSRDLLETELFGHQKGAFTGAVAAKPGLLEVAHHGVVFLDEIGDLDPQLQPKLLKALEEKRFRRLGEVRDRQVDIQLIAATHQNLAASVRNGTFRSDLYFRISAIPLRVPPLRERQGDIPQLACSLLDGCATELGRRGLRLSDAAQRALQRHSWPGNVRELRNVLERAVLLSGREELRAEDLQFETPATEHPEAEEDLTLAEVERRHIERVLGRVGGKVPDAAQRLGVPRSTLYEKLRRLGISPGS